MKNVNHVVKAAVLYSSLGVVLAVAFNNCAKPLAKVALTNSELASSGGNCDEVRMNTYSKTFYPFFRSNCVACHIEGGPGLGTFASPDIATSFAAFSAAGVSKIGYMATNPAHKPPYTGTQNKPAIDRMTATWQTTEENYLQCVAKTQNGGIDESFLTAAKSAPTIYSAAGGTQTLTWDLELPNDIDPSVLRTLPAKISVDVKVLYTLVGTTNYAKGYIFSNPVLQMKDSTTELVIEGLFFYINHSPITSQTTFTNLSRVVSGTSPIPLMKAQANTLIEPLATDDTFQLYVRRLVPTSAAEDAPPPLTPILNIGDKATASSAYLRAADANVFIMRDSGVLRWCLTESPLKPASTEAPCMSGMTGANTVNGWSLVRPTSFNFSAGDGLKTLYLWVANDTLKINDTAAIATIQLDTAAPAAATIGSVNVTDSQVAPMSVSHPNESDVAGWCVFEQNAILPAPAKPKLSDNCWSWTDNGAKPTTVGFKENGNRNIWVFVRDKAGNVSAPSNMATAFNTYGAITLSQLTGNLGKRSVFTNHCYTCHGVAGNPGYQSLQLFDFNSVKQVADSGVLVYRINSTLSPMPNVNGPLLPQDERDLIRLWTMPEAGAYLP